MDFESWHAFYKSDLQAVYWLQVLPAAFLVYWLVTAPGRLAADAPVARFVRLYALLFCIETLIDPVATGPLVRALGLGEGGGTLMGLLFVLLGDFRVFWLVVAVASPQRRPASAIGEAVLWTPIVAVSAFALHAWLGFALGGVPDQLLWMIHELLFVAIAVVLRVFVIARRTAPDDPNRARLMVVFIRAN